MPRISLKVRIPAISLIIANTKIATVPEDVYFPHPAQMRAAQELEFQSPSGKNETLIIDLVSPDPSPESRKKGEVGAADKSPTVKKKKRDELVEPPENKDKTIGDLVSGDFPPASKTKVSSAAAGKSPTVRAKIRDGLVELAIGDGRAAEAFGGAVLGDTGRSAVIEILSSSAGSKKSTRNEPEPIFIPNPLNWDYEYREGMIDENWAIRNSIMAGGDPPPVFGEPLVVSGRAQAQTYPFMGDVQFRSINVPGNGNCFFNTGKLST
jgi:hypothetical protein